jgi:hypothetical protein
MNQLCESIEQAEWDGRVWDGCWETDMMQVDGEASRKKDNKRKGYKNKNRV